MACELHPYTYAALSTTYKQKAICPIYSPVRLFIFQQLKVHSGRLPLIYIFLSTTMQSGKHLADLFTVHFFHPSYMGQP